MSSSRWLRLEEAEELDTSEEPLFRREPFMERMDLESASRSLGRKGRWRWAPSPQGSPGRQGLALVVPAAGHLLSDFGQCPDLSEPQSLSWGPWLGRLHSKPSTAPEPHEH